MATWSTKRKTGYFFVFLIALAILVGLPLFLIFYEAPTCSDNRQNGTERGVDCGGVCAKLCPADFAEPRVLWSHSMQVVPGVYNSLAYIQNPNQLVEAKAVDYLFKLYDDKGLLVAERRGRTSVPAGQRFAVFEGGIRTGERVPARTTFEFTDIPQWVPGEMLSEVSVLDIDIEEGAQPKVGARVSNDSVDQTFSSLDAFVILYDKDDNRLAFSKTQIDSLAPRATTMLYFTWPEAFAGKVIRSEILFVEN